MSLPGMSLILRRRHTLLKTSSSGEVHGSVICVQACVPCISPLCTVATPLPLDVHTSKRTPSLLVNDSVLIQPLSKYCLPGSATNGWQASSKLTFSRPLKSRRSDCSPPCFSDRSNEICTLGVTGVNRQLKPPPAK